MGMQIASQAMRNGVVAAPQHMIQGKRTSLPIEQNAASGQNTTAIPEGQSPGTDDIRETASELVQIGRTFDSRLRFVLDQESEEIIVKVIDKETDKVIRELPPEELQRLNGRAMENIGFLFDGTA